MSAHSIAVCKLSTGCMATCAYKEEHKRIGFDECTLPEDDGKCDQRKEAIIRIEEKP